MTECAVYTGILLSRQRCGKPANVHCGTCGIPLCTEHLVPQPSGPFLCPQCDRYENDSEHEWEHSAGGWRWRGARTRDDTAIPGVLDEQDQEGFVSDAGFAADAESDSPQSDFDAS